MVVLNKEDSFKFRCTQCGECCRGDIIIHLNLVDLQKMAEYLLFENTSELFERGYVGEAKLENGGFLPYILFKTNPVTEPFCPFLENRLLENGEMEGVCRLHPHHKPLVCATAPIGRVIEGYKEQWIYQEPIEGCPASKTGEARDLTSFIKSYSNDFKLEARYFKIMQRMQSLNAAYDQYQSFHSMPVDNDIYDWLAHFEASLAA